MKNNNKRKLFLILIFVLGISIGYATLTSNLNINGGSKVTKATWLIHWANPNVATGSVTTEKPVLSESNTNATWEVTLNKPGDFYEFTIDAVNEGSIDAEILNIKSNFDGVDGTPIITEGENKNLPAYLEYEVTYADENHTEVSVGDALKHGQTRVYRVRIAYSENINPEDLEDEDITTTFYFEVEYKQKEKEPPLPKVARIERQIDDEISKGDIVTIGNPDDNDKFIVIDQDDETVLLLSGFCLLNSTTQGNSRISYMNLRFSETKYWSGVREYESTGNYVNGKPFPNVYSDSCELKPYVNKYANKLEQKGLRVLEKRIPLYEEIIAAINEIKAVDNKSGCHFWTSSAYNASSLNRFNTLDERTIGPPYQAAGNGIRPVIRIPISQFIN